MNAARRLLLRACGCAADEIAVLEGLRARERWAPNGEWSAEEVAAWGAFLKGSLGGKIDVAAYNMGQQALRDAAFARPEEVLARAKFAAGMKAGWEMLKGISLMRMANDAQNDGGADTGAAGEQNHV
jgi:hypothetical protein